MFNFIIFTTYGFVLALCAVFVAARAIINFFKLYKDINYLAVSMIQGICFFMLLAFEAVNNTLRTGTLYQESAFEIPIFFSYICEVVLLFIFTFQSLKLINDSKIVSKMATLLLKTCLSLFALNLCLSIGFSMAYTLYSELSKAGETHLYLVFTLIVFGTYIIHSGHLKLNNLFGVPDKKTDIEPKECNQEVKEERESLC